MRTRLNPPTSQTAPRDCFVGRSCIFSALGVLSLMAAMATACTGELSTAAPIPVVTVQVEPTRTATLPGPATSTPEEGITVSGDVMDASPSAKIIVLEQPDHGIGTIALTNETILQAANGAPMTLTDVTHGDSVMAHGHAGTSGTLLADKIVVGSP